MEFNFIFVFYDGWLYKGEGCPPGEEEKAVSSFLDIIETHNEEKMGPLVFPIRIPIFEEVAPSFNEDRKESLNYINVEFDKLKRRAYPWGE